MNINEMLHQTGAIGAISRELGVDPAVAEAGATALLPSILSGFQNPVAPSTTMRKPTSAFPSFRGLGGLLDIVGSLGGPGLLHNATSNEPTDVAKGNQILSEIFGSKEGSRAVAASAFAQSGVEPSVLKKMLPILAMVAAGYVMKNAKRNDLGHVPSKSPRAAKSAPKSDILGELIGAAGKFLAR